MPLSFACKPGSPCHSLVYEFQRTGFGCSGVFVSFLPFGVFGRPWKPELIPPSAPPPIAQGGAPPSHAAKTGIVRGCLRSRWRVQSCQDEADTRLRER